MSARIRTLTVDCRDWRPLVAFWAEAAGLAEDPDNPNSPDDDEGMLVTPAGMNVLFLPVPEAKTVKNRLHLDLAPTDRSRDEEVERLTALGASLVADHRLDDGTGWVTLADPEGNEFCVERSDAERDAAGS